MLPIALELEALYGGCGRHLGGIYPPLLVDNELTKAYYDSKAPRSAAEILHVHKHKSVLAPVWMAPLGTTSACPLSGSVLSAMVYAAESGWSVIVYADSPDAVHHVRRCAASFVGIQHA